MQAGLTISILRNVFTFSKCNIEHLLWPSAQACISTNLLRDHKSSRCYVPLRRCLVDSRCGRCLRLCAGTWVTGRRCSCSPLLMSRSSRMDCMPHTSERRGYSICLSGTQCTYRHQGWGNHGRRCSRLDPSLYEEDIKSTGLQPKRQNQGDKKNKNSFKNMYNNKARIEQNNNNAMNLTKTKKS